MGNSLKAKLSGRTETKPAEAETPVTDAENQAETFYLPDAVEGIEVEAVIGGALMRMQLAAGTNPAQVKGAILALDPNAKVRDDFPMRGRGPKETKLARALVINVDIKDAGKFIDLVCQNGDDMKVSVPKKASDEWLGQLEALGKVGEKNLLKLRHAFDEKKAATVILPEDEQFGVKYFEIDGKGYLEGMQADPPPETESDDNKE